MKIYLKNKKKYALFAVILITTFFVLFRMLFLRNVILDQDYLFQQVPYRSFIHNTLFSGKLPYIYPYSILGVPIISHGQIGIFFPITFLTLLLKNQFIGYYIELFILFIIGFLGEYIFSKEYLKNEFERIIASVYFAFSPFVFAHIVHLNLLIPYMLLPYSLYLVKNIEKERNYIIGLLSIFVLSLIATHPQLTMIHIVITFIYTLFLPHRLKKIKVVFVLFLFSLFISSIQLIPFLFMRLSGNFPGHSGLSWMMGESFDPFVSWALFFIPFPYPRYGPLNRDIFLYISGALALFAYFIPGEWKKYRIFTYMLLIGIVLMSVRYNPIYIILSKIPMINSTRAHIRWWGGILPFVSIMVGIGSGILVKERNLKRLLLLLLILPLIWILYFLMAKLAAGDKWIYLFNIKEEINLMTFRIFILFSILFLFLKNKRIVYASLLIVEIVFFVNLAYYYNSKKAVFETLNHFKEFKEKRFIGVPADIKTLKILFPQEHRPSTKDFTIYCTFFNGNFSYYLRAYNLLGYVAPALVPDYITHIENTLISVFYKERNIEKACDMLRTLRADYLLSYFPIKNTSCLKTHKKKENVYIYKVIYPKKSFNIRYKDGGYTVSEIPKGSREIEVPVRYIPGIEVLDENGRELEFKPVSDHIIKVKTHGNESILIKYKPIWVYYGALITFLSLIVFVIFFRVYTKE